MAGKRWDQYRIAREEAGATDYKRLPRDHREGAPDDARYSAWAESAGARAQPTLPREARRTEPATRPEPHPGEDGMGGDGVDGLLVTRRLTPAAWVGELRAFTARNAGRLMMLEVDDPELGAQHHGMGLQLRGVAYDPRDRRVEIMIGGVLGGEDHLTHTVGPVSAIDLLSYADGHDRVLRVAAGGGQTLLRLIAF